MMRRALLFLFGLTLALMPLPLSSNRDWAWSPLAAAVGLLLLLCAVEIARAPDAYRRTLAKARSLLVPGGLTAIVILWCLLQASGWTPESWASSISATSIFGTSATVRSIAFDHELLFTGVMRLLTNAGIFLLAAVLGASATNARRLLGTIVVVAVLTTLYAMVAQAVNAQSSWTGVSIWTPHEPYFTGTFLNANNYATYVGVSALAALSLALRPNRFVDPQENARQRWRRRLATFSGMSGFWLAMALILIAGVLFSASRAGMMSLVLGLMAMAALYTSGAVRIAWLLMTPLSIAGLTLLLPGGESLVERMTRLLAQGEPGREMLFPMTAHAIDLRPWTGWGLNSFQELYWVFQPSNLPDYFDKAHNTYLELAFDLGVPAAVTLVVAVLWIVARCLIGFFRRGRDAELAGLGFLIAVLAGFHSLFDFSLQIPAMVGTFFAILGIAWAQSWPSERGPSSSLQ